MLTIQYFGLSCFKLTAKINNQEVSLVTDPFSPASGLKLPRNLAADILTVSRKHENHAYKDGVGGNPFIVEGPGEYETKGVFVYGIPSSVSDDTKKNHITLYRIEIGGISLAHLGDLGHNLRDKEFERLEEVDVLFVPVGGGNVLSAKGAMELINTVQPRIVIPCHFAMPELKEKLDSVDKFLREFGLQTGAGKLEPQNKLKIVKKDLPQEEMEVVLLTKD